MAASDRRVTRALLVFGCLAGVTTYVMTPLERPEQLMLATDVYRTATVAFFESGSLYDTHPPDRGGYYYLYPPITVLVFVPHLLAGSTFAAFLLQTVLNLAAATGTAILIHRGLTRRDIPVTRVDLLLIALFLTLSTYGAIQFINGQINLWLAFALAVGFDLMDRNRTRQAGLAFAIAALFKVFPAIIGIWLLRLRAWGAVTAAVATGIGGLLLGALLFGPELTVTYLTDVLVARFEGSTYDEPPAPGDSVDGVHRQLAALWPATIAYHSVLGLFIIGGLLMAAMWRIDDRIERDAAALATVVAILLYLPIQPLYFPLISFPLLMLLYRDLAPLARHLLVIGTFLTLIHIEQDAVEISLALLSVPDTLADPLLDVTATIFTIILPPTLGLWILLVACVAIQFDAPDVPPRQPTPTTLPSP